MSYESSAKILGWGIQSLRRYLKRIGKDEEPIRKRGRKRRVVRIEDIEELKAELSLARHGVKRSSGTAAIWKKYKGRIQRNFFRKLVRQARNEYKKEVADSWEHVLWHCPRMVWSMDIIEYKFEDGKQFILQTMDMTTKYRFEPIVSDQMFNGEEVAGHTAQLYARHGAPLFQKRDNGGNLNGATMREVLSEYCVVPLNSPAYYPRYNGTMENAQGELKEALDAIISRENIRTTEGFAGAVHRATQMLNHKRRPILGGETSCFNYHRNTASTYSKQQRTEVYQWVKELALDIEGTATYSDKELWFRKAWRIAAETWLKKHAFITVTTPQNVLPISA